MSDNGNSREGRVNRRSLLLGSTSLAAASVLGSATPTRFAQAQPAPPPAAGGRKPNILVIWGDDVGVANVSA